LPRNLVECVIGRQVQAVLNIRYFVEPLYLLSVNGLCVLIKAILNICLSVCLFIQGSLANNVFY